MRKFLITSLIVLFLISGCKGDIDIPRGGGELICGSYKVTCGEYSLKGNITEWSAEKIYEFKEGLKDCEVLFKTEEC